MRPEESLDLLAWKLPIDDPNLRVRLAALARRLEHWAQLLEMANGWLRGRIGRGEPLGQAIDKFDQRLTHKGLTAFDPKISENAIVLGLPASRPAWKTWNRWSGYVSRPWPFFRKTRSSP